MVFEELVRGELVGRARRKVGMQAAQGVEQAGFEGFVARVLQVVAVGGGL